MFYCIFKKKIPNEVINVLAKNGGFLGQSLFRPKVSEVFELISCEC